MNFLTQLKLALKRKSSCFLCLAILCISCEEYEDIAGYKEYLIKEGEHGADDTEIDQMNQHALVYEIVFDSSAIYTLPGEDQADINKLYGFADCNSHHHTNSARFGWRWFEDELQILTYTYGDKIRASQLLGAVDLNKSYRYIIYIHEDTYEFYVEGLTTESVLIERKNNCDVGLYYMLYPYFGGNQTAPQNISIFMSRIHNWYD